MKSTWKLTAEDKQEILSRLKKGESQGSIARDLGVTQQLISYLKKRAACFAAATS